MAKAQCCYSNIMQTGLWGKDLQEKALGKLILMIHTRIKSVIQAMPAWHGGFKSMCEFPCCRWLKENIPENIWMCFSKKKKDVHIIIFNNKGSERLVLWGPYQLH